jgi:hypothetical protein
MNPPLPEDGLGNASLEEIHSALFEQLIMGHGHMALTFLGRLPNPQTGEPDEPDPIAAKVFIDQLEMLVAKTAGNRNPGEDHLLQQTLKAVHDAWVEVLDQQIQEPPPPSHA